MKLKARKNISLLFLLLIVIVMMGIGYSAINSITGLISGKIEATPQTGVFITNIEYLSDIDADLATTEIKYYKGTTMQSTIALSETNASSEIKYKVTVYNNSDTAQDFQGVLYDEEFYDNENITFEISGFNVGETINVKETKEIIITFKYKDQTLPENNVLNSYINFKIGEPNRLVQAQDGESTDNYLTSTVAKEKIESIKFIIGTVPTEGIISTFDASEKQDESIIGYYTDIDSNDLYELTFASKEIIYGNINSSYLFKKLTNVKSIELDNFSTKGVTNMGWMFSKCTSLKILDVSKFDTSEVTDMSWMFEVCDITSLDVSNFNTSNVTNMAGIFYCLQKLESLDITNFDTSKVITMESLFADCSKLTNIDLSNFNTRNVTNMIAMFTRCYGLTSIDVSGFDTSNVTEMYWMFAECENLTTIYVSEYNEETDKGWTTKNVTDKNKQLFWRSVKLVGQNGTVYDTNNMGITYARIDTDETPGYLSKKPAILMAGSIDGSETDPYLRGTIARDKIESVSFVKGTVPEEGIIETFDASADEDGSIIGYYTDTDENEMYELTFVCKDTIYANPNSQGLFYYLAYMQEINLDNLDTSKVTNMMGMFGYCASLTSLDVSKLDTSNVENMYGMFVYCFSLTTLDLSNFNTSSVTDMMMMFGACEKLETIYVSEYNETTKKGWTTKNVTSSFYMFYDCPSLIGENGTTYSESYIDVTYARVDTADIPGYLSLKGKTLMAVEERELAGAEWDANQLVVNSENTYLRGTVKRSKIESIKFIKGDAPTSGIKSQFDASEDQDGSIMGYYTDTDGNGLYELTFVSKVRIYTNTNAGYLFSSLTNLKSIEFDNFSTKGATNMHDMFAECEKLTSIDLSKFDTSKVTDMWGMFYKLSVTSLDVSSFDTSKVASMNGMFNDCRNLTSLDLTNFDTSNVTDMTLIFNVCTSLTTIYVSEYNEKTGKGWTTKNVTEFDNMFTDCSNLVGGNGTIYNKKYTDVTYARIDTDETPGYLTAVYKPTMLMQGATGSGGATYLRGTIIKEKIESVSFIKGTVPTEGIVEQFDASANEDGSIIAYYTDTDSNGMYELTIVSKGDILANTNSEYLFYYLTAVKEIKFDNFDTSNVTNMNSMFDNCSILASIDLSGFDTSKVTNMNYMFWFCNKLTTIYVSEFDEATEKGWTTKNVTSSGSVFSGCSNLVGGNGTTFNSSYKDATYARIDTEETPGYLTEVYKPAILMVAPSEGDETSTYLRGTITKEKIESVSFVKGTVPTEGIVEQFDASEAEEGRIIAYYTDSDANGMYELTFASKKDIYANENLSYFFCLLVNVKEIKLDNFNTSKATTMQALFWRCYNLISVDVSKFDTSNVTNMHDVFCKCNMLTNVDVSGWNTSNVTDMRALFGECYSLMSLDLSNFDTSKVTNMYDMFNHCKALTSLNLGKFNTSNVTDMYQMFNCCENLTTIYVSEYDETQEKGWTTKNVTEFDNMFTDCLNLVGGNGTVYNSSYTDVTYARIDTEETPGYLTGVYEPTTLMEASSEGDQTSTYLRGTITKEKIESISFVKGTVPTDGVIETFDASEAEDGSIIGYYTDTNANEMYELTIVSKADILANPNSSYLFSYIQYAKTIKLQNFDTSNAIDMSYMFQMGLGNNSLTSLDVSSFDTSKVTNMSYMFYSCSGLTNIDVSGFNTSNVTNMKYIFGYCSNLISLDLSSFDTSQVTDMSNMFYYCKYLTTIYVSKYDETTDKGWTTKNVTSSDNMFRECMNLIGGNETGYDASETDATYARIDGEDAEQGYLTKHK